jgi:hypothetical protein
MSYMDRYVPDPLRDTGITFRQLDYWCRRGYLKPQGGEGSGNPRWWPSSELEVARRMVALVRDGYQVAAAARKARELVTS